MGRSEELFERAVKRIPGGVNSPVRAYGAIGTEIYQTCGWMPYL